MTIDRNIVIADEQAICRVGLAALITRKWRGLAIRQADRASGLIALLANDPSITLAIIDVALPGLNEVAGIRHIRSTFPKVRVIVMATVLRRDSMLQCLGAGVQGCISKSLSADEIMDALDMIGRGRIYVPAIICDETSPRCALDGPKALSDRQREILSILATGKSNKEIARKLGISEGTVKVHVNAVFRALGVHNRVGAVAALRDIEGNKGSWEQALPDQTSPLWTTDLRSRIQLNDGHQGSGISVRLPQGEPSAYTFRYR